MTHADYESFHTIIWHTHHIRTHNHTDTLRPHPTPGPPFYHMAMFNLFISLNMRTSSSRPQLKHTNILRIYSYVHVHSAYRRTSFDDGPKCNQPFYRAVVMFAKRIAHARRMHFSSFINSMGRLMDVTQCTRPHAQTDK